MERWNVVPQTALEFFNRQALSIKGCISNSSPIVAAGVKLPKNTDSMITYAELVFGAKCSQNEQKNMIKVNHIREIYPVEELNEGVMEVFADIKAKIFSMKTVSS